MSIETISFPKTSEPDDAGTKMSEAVTRRSSVWFLEEAELLLSVHPIKREAANIRKNTDIKCILLWLFIFAAVMLWEDISLYDYRKN